VWRTRDATPSRVFAGHSSVVQDAEYLDGGHQLVSVGDDGQLLRWSAEGSDVAVLFKHTAPLTGVEALRHSGHAVIKDAAGSVWVVSAAGAARKVRAADGATITVLRASPAGHLLAVGTETGVVTLYDTSSWQVIEIVYTEGSVRQIVFDPMERDLIVASEAGRSQDGHVQVVALAATRRFRWHRVTAAARDVSYSPDGATIAFVCADGGTWLYAVDHDRWIYTRDHDTDTYVGRFSPDGRWFASTDRNGAAVVRDLTPSTAPVSLAGRACATGCEGRAPQILQLTPTQCCLAKESP
jgi:WD40 repeat protein